MKVLNYGSLNYDYVYLVKHMVQLGETISSSGMETHFGGKGLNQSIALAKAGADVYHAGMVGEDGDDLIAVCKKYGVHTDYITKQTGRSGHHTDNARRRKLYYFVQRLQREEHGRKNQRSAGRF